VKETVWAALVGSLVRWLLMLIAGPLVAKGIIGEDLLRRLLDEGAAQVVAAIIAGGVLLWSFRQKIYGFVKAQVARLLPANTSPEQVEAQAAQISVVDKLAIALTPSAQPRVSSIVAALLIPTLLFGSLGLTSCNRLSGNQAISNTRKFLNTLDSAASNTRNAIIITHELFTLGLINGLEARAFTEKLRKLNASVGQVAKGAEKVLTFDEKGNAILVINAASRAEIDRLVDALSAAAQDVLKDPVLLGGVGSVVKSKYSALIAAVNPLIKLLTDIVPKLKAATGVIHQQLAIRPDELRELLRSITAHVQEAEHIPAG
jgi:hypothetical protein